MTEFSPVASLLGGALIGLSATILLVFSGKISGISGVLGSALRQRPHSQWRWAFLGGLVVGGLLVALFRPSALAFTLDRPLPVVAVAGLLVGYGTQRGRGCTSGHGVCGISRGSTRSLTATAVFMAVAVATVAAYRLLTGGVL